MRMLSKVTLLFRNWRVTLAKLEPCCSSLWPYISSYHSLSVNFDKMWIQVRTMDGGKNIRIDDLSKLTKVEHLREKIEKYFDVEPARQRLFYRGKQMEDSHTLFDYDVGLNDIVQLMIRPSFSGCSEGKISTAVINEATKASSLNGVHVNGAKKEAVNGDSQSESDEEAMDTENHQSNGDISTAIVENGHGWLYKVDEKVDARDLSMGAWFEAQVVKVTTETPDAESPCSSTTQHDDVIYYHVRYDDYSEVEIAKLTSADVRPRARYRMQWDQLNLGQKVMVNYNPDQPKERGFWYDAVITRKNNDRREIFAKLVLGESTDASEEIKVMFVDEIFRIETRSSNGPSENGDDEEAVARMKKPDCDWCKDNPRRKCKHCACSVCGGKNDPDKQILCDECDMAYHLWCLSPPLDTVPDVDEWYCPSCKTDCSEVIGAGEKMRVSKKKASMVSKKHGCNRDWGKGMACVGRTKQCTIVPSNHFGPIPGIPVGSLWKFRVQVSESGIHRPHVAGIHGRENEGAYSIVLSGGYDEDIDNGEEFTYSGSGGRDLSGNKRTAKQSMDQKLTHMNKALARNCDAPVDDKKGASAKSWKNGNPVRVVRNHKGSKVSKYAPKEGNRYDGIYKVVKYWPQKNKDGFVVWKYLLRRDDTSPAPWTSEGKKLTKKLGLVMQYPDGYLESMAAKQEPEHNSSEEEGGKKGKKSRKRKTLDSSVTASPVQCKQPRYELTREQKQKIKADSVNKKVWDDVLATVKSQGSAGLLNHIQDMFTCIVCQEVVYHPVTTSCSHNICKCCLSRSFKAEVYTCPNCRCQLGKDFSMTVNKNLQAILLDLFPGYDGGR